MTGAWEVVVGLEVHVQLRTATKMFCACPATVGAVPNASICPVCLGLPGALPAPNAAAVRLAVRLAAAIGAEIQPLSRFDRKHYFYPDLPKGYQITQHEAPLALGGSVPLPGPEERDVPIARLHVEEDAGKMVHDGPGGMTGIDFNRAGMPLVEMVTEPALRSPEEARRFAQRVRQLVRYLEVSDASMERGEFRVDANLSLRDARGGPLGVKCEIKNVNSFAHLEHALHAEAARQRAIVAGGGRVTPVTVTWDASRRTVRPMRGKEGLRDYRYLTDPDLPPLEIDEATVEAERASLPELPWVREGRLVRDLELEPADAVSVTVVRAAADYLEATVAAGAPPAEAVAWVLREVREDAKRHGGVFRVSPGRLAQVIALQQRGILSGNAAARVFGALAERDDDALAVAERLDVVQVRDETVVDAWIEESFGAHPRERDRFLAGEGRLLDFFVGDVMRRSGGRADPSLTRARLLRCGRSPSTGGARSPRPSG